LHRPYPKNSGHPSSQLNPDRLRQHAAGAVGGFFIEAIDLGDVLIIWLRELHRVHFGEGADGAKKR